MTSADPRQDEETAEQHHDEVLDRFEQQCGCIIASDEARNVTFGDTGSDIKRRSAGQLKAREAVHTIGLWNTNQ